MKAIVKIRAKGKGKKENFPHEKSSYCTFLFISSLRKEQGQHRKAREEATSPAEISHTLVLLPRRRGAVGAPAAPMTKELA